LVANKCPHCGKGHVYQRGLLAKFGSLKMNNECPVCHLSFTKDPGFYWGAMYASYGLALVEVLLVYTVARILGTKPFDGINLVYIMGTILVCAPFNFRMARLIWLYVFPKN
jgi:hypothetical protein